jgi:hypothetical protein
MTFDEIEEVLEGIRNMKANIPEDDEGSQIRGLLSGLHADVEDIQAEADEPGDDDEGDEDDDE